jgi:ribonuclease P protein component
MPGLILKPMKGRKIFEEVFENSLKVEGKGGIALIKYVERDSIPNEQKNNPSKDRIIFYAVAISKKSAKKAVIRNRIKRLMRESLRQLLKEKKELFESIEYIVLIRRQAPLHPKAIGLSEVKEDVEYILRKSKN